MLLTHWLTHSKRPSVAPTTRVLKSNATPKPRSYAGEIRRNGVPMFIDEEIEFIKSQIAHHQRSVDFFHTKKDHQKANRHSGILRRFEAMLPKMIEIQEHGLHKVNLPKVETDKVGSRLGDLSDLPEELRKQLVSIQYDETEQAIIDIVTEQFGGIASIDEILVALYRKTKEMPQREALANKIYRMTRKELLTSVSGKKGVYTVSGYNSDNFQEEKTEPPQVHDSGQ